MKIIFICGSLEPGKDGVGDYTRRLCEELLKQGVSVGMLAYNDKHILNSIEEFQKSEEQNIPCLRLPYTWRGDTRCKAAKTWIDSQNPEWLSLQFVPYAFHNKGLPFGLGKQLKKLGKNRKWHVMIHELWIGMSHQSSVKDKCIGLIQKFVIKQLLSKLNTKYIQTQTGLYKHELQKLSYSISILPLFSNILNIAETDNSNQNSYEIDLPQKYFVIFGSIHKNAPINDFVKELDVYDKEKSFSFVAIGRNGKELDNWKLIFEKHGFNLIVLGEQSSERISYVLSNAKFGVVTTPFSLLEKSGSVAAMRAHKLPVICFSRPWKPIGYNLENPFKGVMEYKSGNLKDCILKDSRVDAFGINISSVAESFLKKIE